MKKQIKMQTFTVPVVTSSIGWITIEAENVEAAKKEASRLNIEGVALGDIEDIDTESEVMVEDIMLID